MLLLQGEAWSGAVGARFEGLKRREMPGDCGCRLKSGSMPLGDRVLSTISSGGRRAVMQIRTVRGANDEIV
ncbi:MAG: hypothetical protein CGU28_07955 [Candidatus Dactylopiibacterium carminicum]|uniref:Uncharacterized protein n=1 Tax=Candidatus Dactylopiibacterium carminicum TaxID=857335 RepID=A0ABQ7HPI2_9RHOO|nr:hypothetical protein BGI27_09975 [Candidatus Dactylopiibacterium carminicum]PAS96647.1 MAG: hypothetical protein CGU28_07955 [Candidatus Dactylopiibacterium carminicum]PAS99078.1 MAG: hypothetical protein BSR46_10010 [Candidatus Dactylopiibacterium carminicum]